MESHTNFHGCVVCVCEQDLREDDTEGAETGAAAQTATAYANTADDLYAFGSEIDSQP